MSIGATSADQGNRRATLAAIAGLGVTQIIGWGTTFSPLAVLGTTIGADLAISRELIFAGITVMLLVSAVLAPRMGRIVDARGARPVMMIGSVVAAVAMVMLSLTQGPVTYLLAWVVVGVALPMMLANPALVGLVQVVGPNARRAITGLMLLSGLTGTVFLPLTQWLLETIGWRQAYLVFAALHILICLPLHFLVLRRGNGAGEAPRREGSAPIEGMLPPDKRLPAFLALATWTCTEGLITWGLYMQVIDVFKGLGLSTAAAIGVWAMVGPAQASARLGELVFGARYSILTTATLSAVLTTASFLAILPFAPSVATAAAFSIFMGLGHGFFAIARNTLPLMLFGAREYGAYMGRLTLPQNIVNAAAPILFAAILARYEPIWALWLAGAAAATGLVAVVIMVRTCRLAAPNGSF